ncbi:beta-ketoacyl-[acyl-carrier-protein] synthase family protein [Carboxylicivirga sp. A043]|uniref:beta-ketoacyl-[acyl-carrier-protein] synthase family protein n=1 Tax=Carboxylicivirga litoralis TaxID=2816963 RepID=UPI0021CB4BBE|nr:beta-ketoacyl-[acyl-carrier-protein] synthase family protein [Carboxylicivirga sp. A043]MCU4155832.1 beta-ketoacyl-[acyl-carrier-protein] synthase family protein [Carboxylicivirga sp. A043]
MNIFVTGLGCISPLGFNLKENLAQLRAEQDGLVRSEYLESRYKSEKFYGEVKMDTSSLLDRINVSCKKGLTRTDALAFVAFDEAINHAGLTKTEVESHDTAFISASTVGGMCLTDELYRDANLNTETSEYSGSYNCAAHTLRITKEYKIKGITNTINTACSSSANAIMLGLKLIRSGRVKRAIVGGADSLAKYTVNGFNALQILSDKKCTPFDSERDGLNLGEGAAYIVLEAEEACLSKEKYARLLGAGNTNDAFHTSSMSDTADGVTACIRQALQDGGMAENDIDYINAHGTGTQNNDQVELTGFSNVFKSIPPFSSTKSYTGHTLGAAGSLEAIYSILSIKHNEIYPSLRVSNAIAGFDVSPVAGYTNDITINTVLSNSYGFGGNCTSLLFGKV